MDLSCLVEMMILGRNHGLCNGFLNSLTTIINLLAGKPTFPNIKSIIFCLSTSIPSKVAMGTTEHLFWRQQIALKSPHNLSKLKNLPNFALAFSLYSQQDALLPCPTVRFNPPERIFLEAHRAESFSSEHTISKWPHRVLNPAAAGQGEQVSSAAESWDPGAFITGRRKARKNTRTRKHRYNPAAVRGRGRDRSEGLHPWAWGSPRKEANALPQSSQKAGRTGSEVELQPSLRSVPAPSAARASPWHRAGREQGWLGQEKL